MKWKVSYSRRDQGNITVEADSKEKADEIAHDLLSNHTEHDSHPADDITEVDITDVSMKVS